MHIRHGISAQSGRIAIHVLQLHWHENTAFCNTKYKPQQRQKSVFQPVIETTKHLRDQNDQVKLIALV